MKAMQEMWPCKSDETVSLAPLNPLNLPPPLNMLDLVKRISCDHPEFNGSKQQDAQEFLTHLVSCIHNELLEPMSDVLEVLSGSDIRCAHTTLVSRFWCDTKLSVFM